MVVIANPIVEDSLLNFHHVRDGALPSPDEVATSTDYLKVAVKYVSYRDSNGTVVADEQSVRDMIAIASSVWERCNIGLELVTYEVVDPSAHGLSYNPGHMARSIAQECSSKMISTFS